MATKKKAKRGRPKGSKNKTTKAKAKEPEPILSNRAEDCVVELTRMLKVSGPVAKKKYLEMVKAGKGAGKTEKQVQDAIVGEEKPVDPSPTTDAREIVKEVKKRAVGGAIKDTKLGVTMVLSHKDCEDLGFSLDTVTREVIRQTRTKLGLPEKPQR